MIETLDRRGGSLHFRMTLIQVDHRILVDFRLSRGDGLEFKKHFGKIKTNCKEVIEPGKALPKNNRDGFTSHQSNWICGAKFKHHISEYSIWPFLGPILWPAVVSPDAIPGVPQWIKHPTEKQIGFAGNRNVFFGNSFVNKCGSK